MSVYGVKQFDENLRKLMDSKVFKEASVDEKMELGGKLLRSDFGLGRFLGFGAVCKLWKDK